MSRILSAVHEREISTDQQELLFAVHLHPANKFICFPVKNRLLWAIFHFKYHPAKSGPIGYPGIAFV